MCALVATALLAAAGPAGADGWIGTFFDSTATTTYTSAGAGETVSVYVVAGWRPCRMEAFELSVVVDPRLQVLERRLGNPVWSDFGTGPDNWIVGLGGTNVTGDQRPVLLQYTVQLPANGIHDLLICLGSSEPRSVIPPQPAWMPYYPTCGDVIVPFEFLQRSPDYPAGCGVINPTHQPPVPATLRSLGTLKLSYR